MPVLTRRQSLMHSAESVVYNPLLIQTICGNNIDLLSKFSQTCKDNKTHCDHMIYNIHIVNLGDLLASCNKENNIDDVFKTFEYLEKNKIYFQNSERFAFFWNTVYQRLFHLINNEQWVDGEKFINMFY